MSKKKRRNAKKNIGDEIVSGLRKLVKKLRNSDDIDCTRVEKHGTTYISVPIKLQDIR